MRYIYFLLEAAAVLATFVLPLCLPMLMVMNSLAAYLRCNSK
ncbi:RNA polymerase subunit sigma-70 [Vibrio tarriae]|nr:RNA polymerase subunit sigma-70 [Vibrio tarriae]